MAQTRPFAIGRTQVLLWFLNNMVEHGRIPEIPVALDTPMGTLVTETYASMKKLFDTGASRENEFEADRDAATFCHRAGYSPEAGEAFLQRLASGELPKNVIQQLLSTHPPLSERIAEVRAHAERLRAAAGEVQS